MIVSTVSGEMLSEKSEDRKLDFATCKSPMILVKAVLIMWKL